jgi:BirA family biotin operon repressor/biotin-[acetyl-CoA-carboxylase] ligase
VDDGRWTIDDPPRDVQVALDRVRTRLGRLGREIHWLTTTGSTNDVALRLAEHGAHEGTTVVAEAQTAGRGRYRRSWYSPPGAGLYLSIILRPGAVEYIHRPLFERDTAVTLLTLATGVAIAQVVRATTGLPAAIKWPNDILVGRRKLAGILTEGVSLAGKLQFAVVGIGVNLQPAAYPRELASLATSIEAETNRPADRALIFAETLAEVAGRYGDLLAGRFDAILTAWRNLAHPFRSALVEWDSAGGLVRGRAEDIDDGGALLVRVGDHVHRIFGGEIRWLDLQ